MICKEKEILFGMFINVLFNNNNEQKNMVNLNETNVSFVVNVKLNWQHFYLDCMIDAIYWLSPVDAVSGVSVKVIFENCVFRLERQLIINLINYVLCLKIH